MNAPFSLAKTSVRDPFVGFVCDDYSTDVLRGLATEHGWPTEKVQRGGLRAAVQSLSVAASPHVLFVDLSESGDPLNDINGLAEVCEPGTVVIACGQVNDVRLYRDLIGSGIHDYLLKPLNPDMVRDAITQAQALLNAPKPVETSVERPHCAIAVVGTRGGAGATTIAASLAWLLSDREKRTTALLDLDVHFGTGALALDLEPGRGLTDAIENPSRIDGLFIERAMVRAGERLSVLSAEAPINQPVLTDGAAYYQLQEEMRAAFECTLIDMPRGMLVAHPHLLSDVQSAVIVTELTLAAARDAIRILSWFRSNAPQTTLLVVANRVQPAALLEISRKDFEGSIERKIDFLVPFDGKLAAQSAKLGKPLAEAGKGSKTVAPLLSLAQRLCRMAEDDIDTTTAKARGKAGGTSLLGKLAGLRARLPAKGKAKAGANA
ncbi:pilus assembly protein CpaE [Sphingomonas sp. Leaf407]|uniref:pilus assembly protein CpaE n=1 Tax=unclassified Sphingomonas TaxID=196159 RepID=UPI0006F6AC39|nr:MULTISPECIES: pilus assembly protein CpaE [unclassified Sphingomonas]KQN36594.1 pilus assembly protein CpaE [Sphingomonas sp. Leaf42]KQT27216.1 pilus assembly protein CpaE [Sphingomonas sp. Leaf407]